MISLEWLTVRSGGFQLKQVSFDIPETGYGVLMGKTGSGKTTILEAIAGLRDIDEGTIRLAGQDVTRMSPGERGIGYVLQDRALFQTMTVRQNLAFAPVLRGWHRDEIDARIRPLVDELLRGSG